MPAMQAAQTALKGQGGARQSLEALSNIISTSQAQEPLCPALIVPEGHECMLHVPTDGARGTPLLVKDANGLALFRIVLSEEEEEEGGRAIVLSSAEDQVEFAYCTASPSPPNLTVHHADARQFGEITVEHPGTRYTLTYEQGGCLWCQREPSGRLTLASSGAGRVIGRAEPGEVRAVKVGPGVDMGLVMLAVVSWDLLERGRPQTS